MGAVPCGQRLWVAGAEEHAADTGDRHYAAFLLLVLGEVGGRAAAFTAAGSSSATEWPAVGMVDGAAA